MWFRMARIAVLVGLLAGLFMTELRAQTVSKPLRTVPSANSRDPGTRTGSASEQPSTAQTDPLPSQEKSLVKSSVIVVRPRGWSSAIAEWASYRSREYRIVEVDSQPTASQQHIEILKAASQCSPKASAILLCGDVACEVDPDAEKYNAQSNTTTKSEASKPGTKGKRIETLTPGVVLDTSIRLSGMTTPNLCTDAIFGDMDDDGCPDLAVGRLPAKTPTELSRMLRRSISYEAIPPGPWNDTVHVTAGVGGFGMIADAAIETVTRRFLTEGIPDYFHLNTTYASCTSNYCPNPLAIRQSYIDRINKGGLFWVYIGHGAVTELDYFQVGDQWMPIAEATDAKRFQIQKRPPIAIMLACFTGAFDANVDCFSEHLLGQPDGPIAVIAGSRVTMPYGLSQLASEMINGCFRDEIPTLGEVVLQAKRRIWQPDDAAASDPKNERELVEDSGAKRLDIRKRYEKIVTEMARALSPGNHELVQERREHVRLMNLLGDPLLRIPYPQKISLEIEKVAAADSVLHVTGTSPLAGQLRVELTLVRDRLPEGVAPLSSYRGTTEQHEAMQRTYERSNDLLVSSHEQSVDAGPFSLDIAIPATAKGRYIVSAYVYGNDSWAVGSERLSVRKSK